MSRNENERERKAREASISFEFAYDFVPTHVEDAHALISRTACVFQILQDAKEQGRHEIRRKTFKVGYKSTLKRHLRCKFSQLATDSWKSWYIFACVTKMQHFGFEKHQNNVFNNIFLFVHKNQPIYSLVQVWLQRNGYTNIKMKTLIIINKITEMEGKKRNELLILFWQMVIHIF